MVVDLHYMCFVMTTLVERIEFYIVQIDVSTKELTSYVLQYIKKIKYAL